MFQNKEPWQIAACRFCLKNSESGVSRQELTDYINSEYKNKVHKHLIQGFFEEEIQYPAGRSGSRLGTRDGNSDKYSPPLSVSQMILDHDELKEARQNAKMAHWYSLISIGIALMSLITASGLIESIIDIL